MLEALSGEFRESHAYMELLYAGDLVLMTESEELLMQCRVSSFQSEDIFW